MKLRKVKCRATRRAIRLTKRLEKGKFGNLFKTAEACFNLAFLYSAAVQPKSMHNEGGFMIPQENRNILPVKINFNLTEAE